MLKTVGNPSLRYGDQTIVGGNLVIATAGNGVDFSSNSHATGMTSELLDWYEEGIYTATATPGTSGSVTLKSGSNTLQYTRIGRMVYVSGMLDTLSVSSPVGTLNINLPFAVGNLTNNAERSANSILIDGAVSAPPNAFNAIATAGATSILIFLSNSGTALSATAANQIKADTAIWINFAYVAA